MFLPAAGENNTMREQQPRMCKKASPKMKYGSAIGQHMIKIQNAQKRYKGDNSRIIGQVRFSIHLIVLESVYTDSHPAPM